MKRMSRGASAVRSPARSPFFQGRAARDVQGHPELARQDVGERGLAQAGRAGEEDVVERLAALARRLGVDAEVPDDLLLTHVLVEGGGPERLLEPLLAFAGRGRDVADGADGHSGNPHTTRG